MYSSRAQNMWPVSWVKVETGRVEGTISNRPPAKEKARLKLPPVAKVPSPSFMELTTKIVNDQSVCNFNRCAWLKARMLDSRSGFWLKPRSTRNSLTKSA